MTQVAWRGSAELWLVLFLREELSLALRPAEPARTFRVDSQVFCAIDASAMSAFYDRLVDATGQLVGIRIAPTTTLGCRTLGSVPPRAYIDRTEEEKWLDVYLFGSNRSQAQCEGDQAFGGRIYVAGDDQVAVSLDLGYLASSERDIETVRMIPGLWIEIEAA